MRRFGTHGRVVPEKHYVVPRTEETLNFIDRVKDGKYIVLFAPRQTGKTTFFRLALDRLVAEEPTYFPIHLNFEIYEDCTPMEFYGSLLEHIHEEIEHVFQRRGQVMPEGLAHFLENTQLTNHLSTRRFFRQLAEFLKNYRIICLIDEFDAIPRRALKGFLHALRHIYLGDAPQCPHSVGIVGVKSITQLDYDRSISPFNVQDEFRLPNFTLEEVRDLLGQYTDEVGQPFAPQVIESLHKQTAGQPFLVNRIAQVLTAELNIPKTEPLTLTHFAQAHEQLLRERNTNIDHLRIASYRYSSRPLTDLKTYTSPKKTGMTLLITSPLMARLHWKPF